MLQALLADDEPLSIRMMENLIEWDRYGIRIVATASDGQEALEKFREHMPHIIITDIKMPRLNGIEFIHRAREINADAEIIFISAYADFAFVKEAIALGCTDYLLKPVDEFELERTLQRITRKISEKTLSRQLVQRLETQKQKKAIHDYLRGNGKPEQGRRLLADWYQGGRLLTLMSVSLRHETIAAYTGANSMAAEQATSQLEKVERVASGLMPCLVLEEEDCSWLLVLQTSRKAEAMAVAQELLSFLRHEWKSDARICFSRAGPPEEMAALYSQVMQFDKYSQYLGDVDILGGDDRSGEAELYRARFTEYGKQVMDSLRHRDPAAARRTLQEALGASTAISPEDLSSIYELCFEIVLCVKGLLAGEPPEEPSGAPDATELTYEAITSLRSLQSLSAYMDRVLGMVFSPARGKPEPYTQLVRDGISFLTERYDQNLSLEEICRHLSISKNYFCYLFKRDTGVSLWAYLTDIRMRKAKALLRDTDLKSLEIAYQVGYDNPSYFSKLFKKLQGVTPNEYRLSARQEGNR